MSLLPYQTGDQVFWRGRPAVVTKVLSDRVVLEYVRDGENRVAIIATPEVVRAQQNGVVQAAAPLPWPRNA